MEMHERLRANIEALMRRAGFSRTGDLAIAAGIDPSNFSGMLTGKKRAGKQTLARVAQVLGVDYLDLITTDQAAQMERVDASVQRLEAPRKFAKCLMAVSDKIAPLEDDLPEYEATRLAIRLLQRRLEQLKENEVEEER